MSADASLIRILAVDDHALIRQGISLLVGIPNAGTSTQDQT